MIGKAKSGVLFTKGTPLFALGYKSLFKFQLCAAKAHKKNLHSPFYRPVALLRGSKNASVEPFSGHFRWQTSNLNKEAV
ncbi:hypothetical protein [Rufibacter sp. XAAS-G3-1]|uniref:hypothetical protein n=1 Tax=Rufibacter sp. XAAS-G3-1 TaxID=2729134 RepID=UPI0015E77761|nr:hypothetical protein [Rufibacter sp. XAAS-G3-1]